MNKNVEWRQDSISVVVGVKAILDTLFCLYSLVGNEKYRQPMLAWNNLRKMWEDEDKAYWWEHKANQNLTIRYSWTMMSVRVSQACYFLNILKLIYFYRPREGVQVFQRICNCGEVVQRVYSKKDIPWKKHSLRPVSNPSSTRILDSKIREQWT